MSTQRIESTREQRGASRANARAARADENRQLNDPNLTSLYRIVFHYNHEIDYSSHRHALIGPMDKVCRYCHALKYKNEAPGLCCGSGKVNLPQLNSPPEPLSTLLAGVTPQSKHFLTNIRKYNACFQMTSFGASEIVRENYDTTFKIQGQVYHSAGSLLPMPDADHKYSQIYFMGDAEEQVDQRRTYNTNTRREIVEVLQNLLHERNALVRLFTTAMERMPSDDYTIVIKADKAPAGEHAGRYNAPTMDEVAIMIAGDQSAPRDIVLHRRNTDVKRISETHRSYDALQYPLIFWEGEDGYHFNMKLRNPVGGNSTIVNKKENNDSIYHFDQFFPAIAGRETTKKLSSMKYYAYRLMVRQDNHILKYRKLLNQYMVDMYAKIESERLLFLRMNQESLRSEQYVHLRDAVNTDGNIGDIGKMVILPSTHTGSPGHMHEYAQDAMAFVRAYGRPDLFVTVTCNPKWVEIKEQLLPGQLGTDRHDIVARVFKQKLKSLMDFIVKHKVFGETRCYMYSIEWQKRGLPHAHILIWFADKITPDQIDQIISAEIPDKEVDPELFEIVTKNMIHGPCGTLKPNCPCMVDGKCTKRYPRDLHSETITGNDGYPQYRRRSTEDNGKSFAMKVGSNDVEIDNRWVVPYSPILSKAFKAHINVEYCHSVKAIKYICKYINKGSDMAVFGVANDSRSIDEIQLYQLGWYISSSEAAWRIFSFPIHERYPAVIHLAVHLENGQRVYFTEQNARQRAAEPPRTTLTAFFLLCQSDQFAKTLLYSEVPTYFTWNASTKTFQRRKQGKAEKINTFPKTVTFLPILR